MERQTWHELVTEGTREVRFAFVPAIRKGEKWLVFRDEFQGTDSH